MWDIGHKTSDRCLVLFSFVGLCVNPEDLSRLIAELFVTIKLLSGYPVPEQLPEVHFVSLQALQDVACKGRSCKVKALYHPVKGVMINENLDVVNDVYARSVLMHELVHHLQQVNHKFEDEERACQRWQAREIEAYEVQHKYLKSRNMTQSFIALDSLPITCIE
jgi:hypothetical protein